MVSATIGKEPRRHGAVPHHRPDSARWLGRADGAP